MLPKGIVSTGFPRVRETCRKIGVEFDSWQADLNKCLLAKTADGLYAADTVVLSVARQVGKTFNVGAVVFAECIAEPGTTVIWTAHRFKVARETFNELRALAKTPKLAPHIDYESITTAAGNECIPFRNGSRIVFAARERGAIRGFTKVRILVLDEGQILTDAQLADLAPTMNQASNPLIIIMGTPPKPTDPGEVFTNLRSEALAQFAEQGASDEGVLYVEFSADPDADPDDRAQWRVANPSFPKRTPARAILRLKKLLSPADFLREALGIWDGDRNSTVVPLALWAALADGSDTPPRPIGKVAFCVETKPNRSRTSVSVAGQRPDGFPQIQVVENRDGAAWAVPRLVELAAAHDTFGVVIDTQSAAASLVKEIRDAGLEVIEMNTTDAKQAFGQFYDRCTETASLRHLDQPELNTALKAATTRMVGDARLWDRKTPEDITAIVSASNALWGWTTRQRDLQIF